MGNIKWLFTDCFDTLLLRTCPTDHLRRRWAKNAEVLMDYTIDHKTLYETRSSAERYLISTSPNGEYTWKDLVREIFFRLEMTESVAFCEYFYKAELQAQKDSLCVNYNLLDRLTLQDAPIAVVADSYMGEEFIRTLLFHFKISQDVERIFVSSDYQSSKYGGGLYLQVLSMLQIEGQDAVMYGDKMNTDVEEAQQCGIKGILVEDQTDFRENAGKFIRKLKKVSLFKRKYHPDSFSNFAMTFSLFAERLYKRCVQDKIECLYFLAGTGELLKTLFDAYCEEMNVNIPTYYLYASEQSVLLVNMSELQEEDFGILKSRYKELSIRKFLQLVGFLEEEIKTLDQDNAIDYDIDIAGFWESKELKTILRDEFFIARYNELVLEAKKCLYLYLEQKNFYDYNKIALVDLGWDGRIQDGLDIMLEEGQTMQGYYFGLNSQAVTTPEERKYGLMFQDLTGLSLHNDVWSFHVEYLANLLTASHGETVSYAQRGNTVFPVIRENPLEKEAYILVKGIQEQIETRFRQITGLFRESGYTCEDYYGHVLRNHVHTLMDIGRVKGKFQQKLYEHKVRHVTWQDKKSMTEYLMKRHLFALIPCVSFFEKRRLLKKGRYYN